METENLGCYVRCCRGCCLVGAERAGVVCFVHAKRAREEISEETWASSSGSLRYF